MIPECEFLKSGQFSQMQQNELAPDTNLLTWSFKRTSEDIPGEKKEIKAMKRVFLKIGQVIPVKFKFLKNNLNADIVITVSNADSYFIDRPNALAYAYVGTTSQAVDLVFNESYIWVLNREKGLNRYDLEIVGIHEVLHVLGLRHNAEDPESVMFPNYRGISKLSLQDIENLQDIWGARSGWSKRLEWLKGYFQRII